jgi:quercetin dioxygenase-like cupin family protein
MTFTPPVPAPGPVVLRRGEGTPLRVFGNPWRVLLTSEQTAGRIALIEGGFSPGAGVPPHRHSGHDEGFYVLDGTFRFRVGDRYVELGPGGFCHVPAGQAHAFENMGDAMGTLLGQMTPGGFERLFIELDALPDDPPDPQAVQAVFARHDQQLVTD